MHERIAGELRAAIASGRYPEGGRLPTHRQIAQVHGVAIGTITRAIDQLAKEGLVRGEVGRGTFVLPTPSAASDGVIDLSMNFPPPMISEPALQTAASAGLRRAMAIPNGGYADLRGAPRQRQVLAEWVQDRAPDVAADDLLVCVGAQHAIHLAFADLKERTKGVASEGATFSGALAAADNLELAMHGVAHDGEGMMPEALDRLLKKTGCRAVYTVPVCQNPLGFETGQARRQALLEVCLRHEAWIVEDDVYGVYASTPAATYKARAPERVYYLTSTSKSLSPLLRVGVLAPPVDRLPALQRRLRAEAWGMSPLAIEIGCALIENGTAAHVAAALREEAAARIQLAVELLGVTPPMPAGAPHLWLPMPMTEAERLVRRAADRGVRLTPPDATVLGQEVGGVRLCLMAPPRQSDLVRALRVVATLRDRVDEVIV